MGYNNDSTREQHSPEKEQSTPVNYGVATLRPAKTIIEPPVKSPPVKNPPVKKPPVKKPKDSIKEDLRKTNNRGWRDLYPGAIWPPRDELGDEYRKAIAAGDKLAEAAHQVQAHHDGIHRMRLAIAEWYKVRADEFGRDKGAIH